MTQNMNEITTGLTSGIGVGILWALREIIPWLKKMRNGNGSNLRDVGNGIKNLCLQHAERISRNTTNIKNLKESIDSLKTDMNDQFVHADRRFDQIIEKIGNIQK